MIFFSIYHKYLARYIFVEFWHRLCQIFSFNGSTFGLSGTPFILTELLKPLGTHLRGQGIPDQYLFLGNRARYRFVVLDYHSCSISKRRTTFSIWATELDSCSPYSNSNSSTISNQPRINICFWATELDIDLSYSITIPAR